MRLNNSGFCRESIVRFTISCSDHNENDRGIAVVLKLCGSLVYEPTKGRLARPEADAWKN